MLLAVAALAPLPAAAQATDSAPARTVILDPATVFNETDMDFGQITTSGTNGTVVLTPSAAATCTTTGGLIHAGPCHASKFSGTAFYQADLRVQRPNGNRIDLTGPGGATMRLDAFTFNSTAPTVYLGNNGANHRFRVDALDGSYTFYVGGTLHVAGTQAIGLYTGNYEIRVTYN